MSIAYNATWSAVARPGSATDFFSLGGDLTNLDALCAEMARVVYAPWTCLHRKKFNAYLSRAGFGKPLTVDVRGTEAFVTSNASTTVVSFRGTQLSDPFDLFTDAQLALSDWSSGGRVHTGFRASINEIWPTLVKAIDRRHGKKLVYTGHSLGAALAVLAASLRAPDLLVTLASPRVGDHEFGRTIAGVNHHRYVNCADLVPRVPGGDYTETGLLHFIDADANIVVDPAPVFVDETRRKAITDYRELCSLLRGRVPSREIADHAPINYVSAILGIRSPGSPGQ